MLKQLHTLQSGKDPVLDMPWRKLQPGITQTAYSCQELIALYEAGVKCEKEGETEMNC